MKKLSSATDPLWYKDAVIYELHVRAFQDSNDDGIGDFQGLLSRLDYLQDLGVTCLWLLPFFPSPLRDDGYDIADYTNVNPSYGTLSDFQEFLTAAHQRGMQVMIELVINHTSDQHPWFQAARRAPKGSAERDFYVWSDTADLYKDARIIFTDTEKSNWTWDDEAQAYYWHRFFSHQPDLNFDNPAVMEEILKAMRFWLDMGVDAMRMDAIPYLVERDGSSCENLPETHVVIKKIRAAIDADYANRLVLAEANQWPADVRPYFGDGDECHMAFHFPLMPRIYMALRQEDRLPITDIMAQTPAIPPNCQWGLFLRNHDELTLEMVTSDERDYMYFAYSADPRMRVNVGIRRRLAPLVDNNRRRIELLNSLLLSFPGTPILYYGDEIGMGDNIYLGDRNGVRTPMQWNSDRNAGFSKAVPAKLYFPVIMDPVWGYQAINVEAQQSDPSSLLHWTRNMIALRKLFHVFGRGTLEFLNPENRKIIAYIRRYDPSATDASETAQNIPAPSETVETVLCVANLSRFAQPVSLNLSQFVGMVPVEMLGYVSFPPITTQPYPLTLAPYSFLWFELQAAPPQATPAAAADEENALSLKPGGIDDLLTGHALDTLQQILPKYLFGQRWFGAKSRVVYSIAIRSAVRIPNIEAIILFLAVRYEDVDAEDIYQLPLVISMGEIADTIRENAPASILATINTASGPAILHDAVQREDFRTALLQFVASNVEIGTEEAKLRGGHGASLSQTQTMSSRVGTAEQSNTSIFYDDKFFLKLFRRIQPGKNPDTEIGRFLTDETRFQRIAPFFGEITLTTPDIEPTSVAILQGIVQNEGDGWSWTLDELVRYYESVATCPAPQDIDHAPSFAEPEKVPELAKEHAGLYLDAASLLGRRTAELHLALATPNDDTSFSPEAFTAKDLADDAARIETQIAQTLETLKCKLTELPNDTSDDAARLIGQRNSLLRRARALTQIQPAEAGERIRIHGDYHLGQLLLSRGDFIILDFEGEPARSLPERRRKQSPLKDVAGMLRSFSYASFAGLEQFYLHAGQSRNLEPWAHLWQNAASTEFLRSYRAALDQSPHLIPQPAQAQIMLNAYLLEKALYELLYELNNRPAWVRIPLVGILALPE